MPGSIPSLDVGATEGERTGVRLLNARLRHRLGSRSEKNQCPVLTGPHNFASEPRQLSSFLGHHWRQTSLSVIPEGFCELQNLDPQSLSSASWKRELASSLVNLAGLLLDLQNVVHCCVALGSHFAFL